jgi:Tfp pilus assembly PilM family ATPase
MAKQLVIDWQKDGLLFAQGSARGNKIIVDRASFQRVGEGENGRTITSEEALHKAVAELGSKGEVIVIASREAVEMRTVSVPKIDPDELPDVIRFQAQRQMTSLTDNWAVDFVLLPAIDGQEMQTALVAGIAPPQMNEIERACHSAGLTVTQITLRPLDIVRYARDSGKLDANVATMVVCVSESKADLLILRQGQCIQVRGTRLPHDLDEAAVALKGELRRSMMAASAHLGGQEITSLLLISSSALADRLDGALAEAAGAPVTHLDPALLLPAELADRSELAEASHRLAAVAGAISLDGADQRTTLDFKNPKKRPPKKKNTGRYILYGGAAAALLLGGLGWWYSTSTRLDRELADLQSQLAEKKDLLVLANNKMRDWKQVQSFLDTAPNWLDELTYISQRIPGSDKVIVQAPSFNVSRAGVGTINFKMRADASETIGAFEKSLQGEQYVVQGSNSMETPQSKDRYKWSVDETITLKGRGWDPFTTASSDQRSESTTDEQAAVNEDTATVEQALADTPVTADELKAADGEIAADEAIAADELNTADEAIADDESSAETETNRDEPSDS